jgi:hypothetical protein
METKDETEKIEVENEYEEKAELQKSRRKSLKQKIVTAALVGGLLTGGGCTASKGLEQKNTEPINSDPVEEVDGSKTEIDINDDEVTIESEKTYPSLIEKNDSFQLNLSSDILDYIDNVYPTENEVLKHAVFEVKKEQDHLKNVEQFVLSVANQQVERENPLPSSPSYSKWEMDNGFISYSEYNHFLEMEFKDPLFLNDLQINPESKKSVQEGLQKLGADFFDENFDYRVDEIVKEGDYYRVNYSRLLEGVPVYQADYPLYLVLTQDGKLKEGRIWLQEFEETGEVSLLSRDKFAQNINKKEFPKSVSFTVPGLTETGALSDFFPHHSNLSLPDEQKAGFIRLESVELVHYYRFHRDETFAMPMFRLKGSGVINPEVMFIGDEKVREATFEVLVNAADSKYIQDFSE